MAPPYHMVEGLLWQYLQSRVKEAEIMPRSEMSSHGVILGTKKRGVELRNEVWNHGAQNRGLAR